MTTQEIRIIQKSVLISTCTVLSMFLMSCSSASSKIAPGKLESTIYTKDVTEKCLKSRIVVGENGGYWEYNEKIKETGCNIEVKSEVSDKDCLDEWSCDEACFPDVKPAEPYKCICAVGWTYHSIRGDSSPAMNWDIHVVASGDVNLDGWTSVSFGGQASNTAEAVSSAMATCNDVVVKNEQLIEKIEDSKPLSGTLKSFIINSQKSGVLPAGSTFIELKTELTALVKANVKAQAGLMSFLSPAVSTAKAHASVEISKLGFISFYRAKEE